MKYKSCCDTEWNSESKRGNLEQNLDFCTCCLRGLCWRSGMLLNIRRVQPVTVQAAHILEQHIIKCCAFFKLFFRSYFCCILGNNHFKELEPWALQPLVRKCSNIPSPKVSLTVSVLVWEEAVPSYLTFHLTLCWRLFMIDWWWWCNNWFLAINSKIIHNYYGKMF